MTTVENNKAIACKFLQLISEKKLDEMCTMITTDWIMLGGPPNLPKGEAGLRELFIHLTNINQQWTINDVIAEGDKVLVRATNTCSTQDSFFGIQGKNKQQVFTAMFLHRIENGKIAETWRNADDLGRVFQLGGIVVTGVS